MYGSAKQGRMGREFPTPIYILYIFIFFKKGDTDARREKNPSHASLQASKA